MLDLSMLVPADTYPLDLSRPVCHRTRDQWGTIQNAFSDGTVTVDWNKGGRSTTKPLGWFRVKPRPAASPRPLYVAPAEVRFLVKLDGVQVGTSYGDLPSAEAFATSVKRANLRKEVRVEEVTVVRRTVAYADRKGPGAVVVRVNGGN